jgi:ABC-type lipoprotein release transport system permease subunit
MIETDLIGIIETETGSLDNHQLEEGIQETEVLVEFHMKEVDMIGIQVVDLSQEKEVIAEIEDETPDLETTDHQIAKKI